MLLYMYSPRAGADNPLGTNVDVNRKPLSLCPFIASFKTISLKYDFKHILNDFVHVYWHKQETSTLHLCLLIPNECKQFIPMFCFNNVDYSAMVCAKQKSIRWPLAPMTTQAPVPKFRKLQNQYLVCSSCFNHRSTSQHHWADTLLRFYEC